MGAVASDRSSRSASRYSARRNAFCPVLAQACFTLVLFFSSFPAVAQQGVSGWSTVVEPAPRVVEHIPTGGLDTGLPTAFERNGVSIRVENDNGAPAKEESSRFLVVRGGFAREVDSGPYVGAAVGLEKAYGSVEEEFSGKLVGGVAAPVSDAVQLYGEYQHLRSLESSGADDRFQLGLRRKF